MANPLGKLNAKSVFFKMAVMMILAIGAVSSTVTLVNEIQSVRLTRELMQEMVGAQTRLIGDAVAGGVKFGKADLVEHQFEAAQEDSAGHMAGILALNNEGDVLSEIIGPESDRAEMLSLGREALASGTQQRSADGLSVAQLLTFGEKQATVGVVVNDWTPKVFEARMITAMYKAITAAGVVFLVAVVAVMFLFGRSVVKPLERCRTAIQRMGQADYSVEVTGTERGDEIGDISKSLEVLRGALAAAAEVQREAIFKSSAFTNCSSSMMILDEDFVIRHVNDEMRGQVDRNREAITKLNGPVDPDSMVGGTIDLFHKNSQDIRRMLSRLDGKPFKTVVRLDDARIALTINAIPGEGGHAGYVMEWADVTRDWLNGALIEAIEGNQVKAEFDVSGRLLTANQRFRDALHASQSDVGTLSLRKALCDEEGGARAAEVLDHVNDGKSHVGKLKLTGSGDQRATIDGSLSPVCDHDGKPIRLLLLGQDVTDVERHLAEARVERETAERNQNQVVESLRVGLNRLSDGDLTSSITTPFAGSYEELRRDFNATVENLASALRVIAENAENIHNEARDISTTSDGLSRRTESTAATLEETAAALDKLTASVQSAAKGAAKADEAVSAAKANAEESGRVVLDTVAAMDQIAESSGKITSIIKVIDDIAFQTNLLALNAGVEAARAGDAGRGFAVVASEVRALAQRSSDAAREINDLIAKSGTQVKTGVDLVGQTGTALRQIVESVSEISELVSEIAVSSHEQSGNLAEINSAVTQLDGSTQQNAARLEETSAAAEALRHDAVTLVDTVSHFKVSHETRESGGKIQASGGASAKSAQSGAMDKGTKANTESMAAAKATGAHRGEDTKSVSGGNRKTGDSANVEVTRRQTAPARKAAATGNGPIGTAETQWEDF